MREIKLCLRCGQLEAEITKKDKMLEKACKFIEEVHGTCPSDTGYPEPIELSTCDHDGGAVIYDLDDLQAGKELTDTYVIKATCNQCGEIIKYKLELKEN